MISKGVKSIFPIKHQDIWDKYKLHIQAFWTPEEVSEHCFWPILESIQTLYRNDQMTSVAHHYATRLLRSLVDQVQAGYTQQSSNNKHMLLFCGPSEGDDLAAQIVADLCEAVGANVQEVSKAGKK